VANAFTVTIAKSSDAVVLPRKWLLLDSMPLTTQGKINQYILKALLDPNSQKLSQAQCVCARSSSTVKLTLRLPDDLIYFPDHFSGCPILSAWFR